MPQWSGWLLDSLVRICASKLSIWILPFLLVLCVFPSPTTSNKCITGGVYLNMTANGTIVVNAPESMTLEDVENKSCAFKIDKLDIFCSSRLEDSQVEFLAVEVREGTNPFCSFWSTYVLCVCDFFGCNSVTGVFYDTLLKALSYTGTIEGVDYSLKYLGSRQQTVNEVTDCTLNNVEEAYKNMTANMPRRNRAKKFRDDLEEVDLRRGDCPHLFPDPKAVERKLKTKDEIEKTIQTASEASKPSEQPNEASETTPTASDSSLSSHEYIVCVLITAVFARQFV